MKKSRIAVVGAGTMGATIALSFARHGFEVYLCDVQAAQLDKARMAIRNHAELMRKHDMLSVTIEEVFAGITFGTEIEAAAREAVLVIEAVREDLDIKRQLFADLDRMCAPDTILASTTSTLVPSALAAGLVNQERRGRLLVMHYWNPAHLIPLVEVVPHPDTCQEVLDFVEQLLRQCAMHPIMLRKEIPGFVGNRLAFALQREAMSLVASGVVTAEDIDRVVTMSFGRRMPVSGVFGTADLGGLDVYLAICRLLFPDLCNDSKPPVVLQHMVEQGKLGVKTGAGWKPYAAEQITTLFNALTEELVRHAKRDRSAGLVASDSAETGNPKRPAI